MAFGSMDSSDSGAPLAEINMVPLIDVMLVLLIIFIVTAPLLTHAVKVDLPKAASTANETRPRPPIRLGCGVVCIHLAPGAFGLKSSVFPCPDRDYCCSADLSRLWGYSTKIGGTVNHEQGQCPPFPPVGPLGDCAGDSLLGDAL